MDEFRGEEKWGNKTTKNNGFQSSALGCKHHVLFVSFPAVPECSRVRAGPIRTRVFVRKFPRNKQKKQKNTRTGLQKVAINQRASMLSIAA